MGKGGFKLSLRGQDPDLDWLALAREQGGRRVNMVEPEQSFSLLKATAAVAHEGGKRFDAASPEYDIFLHWLRDGAADSGAARRLVKLEVTPREQVLIEPASEVRLKAVATFADGTARDVTRLAVFDPNNLGVKVSVDGTVTREHFGETTVLVRFLGQQVPVRLAFAPARTDFVWSNPPAVNFVDEHVFKKLRTLRMNPAGLCDDATFLRRAWLDLLGIVPTPEAVRAFSGDSAPLGSAESVAKRAKLADSLMQRGEFATFWALKWADLLKIEERQLDSKGMEVFHGWIREAIAANKPLDQFARELVAARGSTYKNPPANWWRANRDPVTRAENTARVFLGTQLNCAQCHNHPFERWTQDDYYDWTSLFSRVDYKIIENKKRDKSDRNEFKGDQIVLIKAGIPGVPNPRTGQQARARFLGGEMPKTTPDHDELQSLADWISRSPMFSRTQANRIWVQLMGRGIVDPVDDFRASNPPTHPELLDALAKRFTASGCDLKALIRDIAQSRAYQLSAVPNEHNKSDRQNFSRYFPKRLTAEVLFDSVNQITGTASSFSGLPAGTRAIALPDNSFNAGSYFLTVFGRPDSSSACECERTQEASLAQCLHLLNAKEIQEKLGAGNGRVAQFAADPRSDEEKLRELYLAAFSREPVAEELALAKAHLDKPRNAPDGKPLDAAKAKRDGYEDVVWAVLNTKEFLFNH